MRCSTLSRASCVALAHGHEHPAVTVLSMASPILARSSSSVRSPVPINLIPALSRPRSTNCFAKTPACPLAGTNTKSVSGFRSRTRWRNGVGDRAQAQGPGDFSPRPTRRGGRKKEANIAENESPFGSPYVSVLRSANASQAPRLKPSLVRRKSVTITNKGRAATADVTSWICLGTQCYIYPCSTGLKYQMFGNPHCCFAFL